MKSLVIPDGEHRLLSVEERINKIKCELEVILTDVLSVDDSNHGISRRKGHTEVTFDLSRQYMIWDIKDILVNGTGMKILYASCTTDETSWKMIGFTQPCIEQLYMVFINSTEHGVVDNVTIDIYDSMEGMLESIRRIYFSIIEGPGNSKDKFHTRILEKMQAKDIWRVFFIQ